MKRVISFSLWGDKPKYLVGAIENAKLCPQIYPGWVARFYVGTSVAPETLQTLRLLGAEIIEMNVPGDWRSMFWRFEAAADTEIEAMLSRDCDSRLNHREAAAVAEWMASSKGFHIMRDHPSHDTPILGGMWGVKAPLLRDISDLIQQYVKGDFWQVDQNFLREVIYPKVKSAAMIHDEFYAQLPFPIRRQGWEFVGEDFDEFGQPSLKGRQALAKVVIFRRAWDIFVPFRQKWKLLSALISLAHRFKGSLRQMLHSH